jgi:hypothetical protein
MKNKVGYMDQIADQEAKLISMNSLEEGEQFEADINKIMGIIDDVEKNMCQQKLSNQFKRNANMSYNRRKLEMTRTLNAQNNHQSNFMARQQHANLANTQQLKDAAMS